MIQIMRKVITDRIRQLRTDSRLTQRDVAALINVNLLTYKGYENCRSEIPIFYLMRIADLFNVSLDYIIGRTNKKEDFYEDK